MSMPGPQRIRRLDYWSLVGLSARFQKHELASVVGAISAGGFVNVYSHSAC